MSGWSQHWSGTGLGHIRQTAFSGTAWEGNLGTEGNRSQRVGDRMIERQITGLDDGRVKEVLDQLEALVTEYAKTCIEWTHAKRKPRPLAAAKTMTSLQFVIGTSKGTWSDVCGFLKLPDSHERWQVRQHGAFSIHHEALGLRSKDQSCHDVWLHLDFVDHHSNCEPREKHEQRLLLKERSAPYQHSKKRCKTGEDESDLSISS